MRRVPRKHPENKWCSSKRPETDGKTVPGGYQDGKPWEAEIMHLAKWLPVITWKANDKPVLTALDIRVARWFIHASQRGIMHLRGEGFRSRLCLSLMDEPWAK